MIDKSKFTHDAFIFKSEGVRKGRRLGFWVAEGYARIEPDGSLFVYLHSTPIGGFDGRIRCIKYGSKPPGINPAPQRPGENGPGEEEGDNEGDEAEA
jgi:hypothetical protein